MMLLIHAARRGVPKLALMSLALASLAFSPGTASAVLTLSLSSGNPALSGYPGPYGTVAVTATSTTMADITFTGLDSSPGGEHFLFGDGGSIGLNVNGTGISFTYDNVTQPQVVGGGTDAPSFSRDDGSNLDGFGAFNFVLDNADGFKNAFRTITLHLTATTANWTTDASVLTPNALGTLAGAHIFVANSDYTNTNNTGFAAQGNVTAVPEPSTLVAAASALVPFGCLLCAVGVGRRPPCPKRCDLVTVQRMAGAAPTWPGHPPVSRSAVPAYLPERPRVIAPGIGQVYQKRTSVANSLELFG